MKKRLLTIVIALVTVLACAFNVLACGNSSSSSSSTYDGTYYLYQNDEHSENDYIKINNGKVVNFVMNGKSATDGAKLSSNIGNNTLTITVTANSGNQKTLYTCEIKSGVIHLTDADTYRDGSFYGNRTYDMYFCKKNKTPDDVGGNSGIGGIGGDSSSTDFEMPKGGFDTQTPIEIKFYHTMGQSLNNVVLNYLEQFTTLYPNVTITQLPILDYEDLRDRIATEIENGEQPDLAFCYPDHVALFNQSNAVLPLNDFLSDGAFKNMTVKNTAGTENLGFTAAQENAFIPAYFNEGYQFGDGSKMYTLPFAKSTEVLYYNKTFFEANDISVPTTWEEMEAVCARLKQLNRSCIPLGYDSEANWFINMCEQYGSGYTSTTGNPFLFDNQTNRNFVTKFKDWYDNGYFTTREANRGYTSDRFKTQASYMCIASSAGAMSMVPTRVDGTYPFEVGIAPIPQVDPNSPKVISQGPSLCIFKQDNPQKVLASWLLAKFLTTNVDLQAQYSSVSGYVPVLATVMQNATYQSNLNSANGYEKTPFLAAKVCMAQANSYFTTPAFIGSAKARDEVGRIMTSVFADAKTVDSAFRDAIEECEYFVR